MPGSEGVEKQSLALHVAGACKYVLKAFQGVSNVIESVWTGREAWTKQKDAACRSTSTQQRQPCAQTMRSAMASAVVKAEVDEKNKHDVT
jgi:hypothetical protein